jgi:hypothetical protein
MMSREMNRGRFGTVRSFASEKRDEGWVGQFKKARFLVGGDRRITV